MKLELALLATVALASCIPTNQSIVEGADARSSQAESEARTELDRIRSTWEEESDASLARWQASLIFPFCDQVEMVPVGSTCGMLADMYSKPTFQRDFAEQRCGGAALSGDAPQDFCLNLFRSAFNVALGKRYSLTPQEVCPANDCGSFSNLELLMVNRVNAEADRRGQFEVEMINAKYREESEAALARFKARANQINKETEADLADAQRARAAFDAVGAGLKAYADSMANAQSQQAAWANATPEQVAPASALRGQNGRGGCSSDFECGFGNVCAKAGGAYRGICAHPLNAYGMPIVQAPSADSIAPGAGACSFETDCFVGFRCVKSSGGLRGNCMK